MTRLATVALLASLICLSCQREAAEPNRAQRQSALGAGDASATDTAPAETAGGGCLAIPPEGCCEGEALWWCEDGALQSLSCADRPFCGWSSAGFFDCNTSGQSDPSGRLLKSCRRLLGDAGPLPALDARLPDAARDPCGGVPMQGCCASQQLRYCQDGTLQEIDCSRNTSCGWQANGQIYDCGTTGGADPQGRFPLSCPGPLPDAQADGPADARGDATDLAGVDGGDGGSGRDGCHCRVGSRSSLAQTWALSALLLLFVYWRRS